MTSESNSKGKSNCAPVPSILSSERFFVGLLALVMSIAALVFGSLLSRHYVFPHDFQNNIDRPILAIELPGSADDLRHVLRTDDPGESESQCQSAQAQATVEEWNIALAVTALRANTYQDFLFIVLYSLFL